MAKQGNLSGGILRMNRVREIYRLHFEQGCNQREIHRATGVARSCIQSYLQLAKLKGLDYQQAKALSDDELRGVLSKKSPGRNRLLNQEPDFRQVHRELKSRKGTTLELLWMEWRQRESEGYSYSTFCTRYLEWGKAEKVSMRQEYEPGDKMLSDYSGEKLSYFDEDGAEQKVEIFVATLGFSNLTYVEATDTQKIVDWVNSHIRAFEFFNGVTAATVTDNLKSAVIKTSRYEPELQQTFEEFGEHYQTTILPTRSAKPRDKAKVEKAVQDIQRAILAPLRHKRFNSLVEINQALAPLITAFNEKKMQEYGVSRNELFEQEEKRALRPLPTYPLVVGTWKRARVHSRDYHVQTDFHWYSVPYQLAGKEVWVKCSDKLVEIFQGNQRVASHLRSHRKYRFTTNSQHMPPHHKAFRSQCSEEFLLDWARGVGPETEKQVITLLNSPKHKEQAFRSILGLQRLEKTYGTILLELGAARANRAQVSSQSFVKRCIELERNKANTNNLTTPGHANVRGPGYFH